MSNGTVGKEKRGKKSDKGKKGNDDDFLKRAERLRQLANYEAAENRDVDVRASKGRAGKEDKGRGSKRDGKRDKKGRQGSEERDQSSDDEIDDRGRGRNEDTRGKGRRERILSDQDNLRDNVDNRGERGFRVTGHQDRYSDVDGGRPERGDRFDNRSRNFDDRGDSLDRRGRNQYRNIDTGDDRRQKRDFDDGGNICFRNDRVRDRGDNRMNRNVGRNRSEERAPRPGRDDRRRRR